MAEATEAEATEAEPTTAGRLPLWRTANRVGYLASAANFVLYFALWPFGQEARAARAPRGPIRRNRRSTAFSLVRGTVGRVGRLWRVIYRWPLIALTYQFFVGGISLGVGALGGWLLMAGIVAFNANNLIALARRAFHQRSFANGTNPQPPPPPRPFYIEGQGSQWGIHDHTPTVTDTVFHQRRYTNHAPPIQVVTRTRAAFGRGAVRVSDGIYGFASNMGTQAKDLFEQRRGKGPKNTK